ncbi:type 1 glutamine amidotransferase domain-containing protein [Sphingobacterium suaedae]|uniref:Type 1 glutamine amidotransferase domain-containing protein n=1 Tax=Sphingobacterium suaedae TaxID=1686402 RepID=A0ABW5KJS7_9SPHI
MTKKIYLLMIAVFFYCTATAQKKVLFVMSAAQELELKKGKTYKTGVFLSEFYLAYKDIVQAGYEVEFATPEGIKPTIDKESYHKKYWSGRDSLITEAASFIQENEKFNHPRKLAEIVHHIWSYSGLVIPGGQGLMADLIKDKNIPALLMAFSDTGKPIGLICHAPALLLSMPKVENPFTGYCVSAVTALEELFIETFVIKGKPVIRKIGKQLKKAGLKYKKGRPAGNFAIRDRELITSQNPYSSMAFGKLYLEALNEYQTQKTPR